MATANLSHDEVVINLLDFSERFCSRDKDSPMEPAGAFTVNGTPVKFVRACMNGNRFLSPATPEGKKFFAKAMTGGPVTIQLDFGMTLHFRGENFEAAKKAMLNARSAI